MQVQVLFTNIFKNKVFLKSVLSYVVITFINRLKMKQKQRAKKLKAKGKTFPLI